jgi:alpha-glucosidase
MPWTDDPLAGFSSGSAWLPVPQEHRALAVARQEIDPASALQGFRTFMRWRHAQPALRTGDIHFLETAEPILAFMRSCGDDALLVAFNLSEHDAVMDLPLDGALPLLDGHGLPPGRVQNGRLYLPGYGSVFARLDAAQRQVIETGRA